jgi:purine-nucleoside phosphorylase
MIDLNFKYNNLIQFIKQEAPFKPEIAIVLGSGLGEFADSFETTKIIDSEELPGYPASAVEGHSSQINFAIYNSKKLLIFKGRSHF